MKDLHSPTIVKRSNNGSKLLCDDVLQPALQALFPATIHFIVLNDHLVNQQK